MSVPKRELLLKMSAMVGAKTLRFAEGLTEEQVDHVLEIAFVGATVAPKQADADNTAHLMALRGALTRRAQ